VALSAAAINLALSVILSDIGTADSYQTFRLVLGTTQVMGKPPIFGNVAGLALANSLATAYEVVVLLVILRRRWHSIHETQLASTTAKTIVASLVMALAILGIELAWSVLGLDARGQIFTVVLLGLQVGLGGIVFTIVALVLNMGEVREILGLIRDRLRPARRVTA
jgi:peptidoglycan biosynthesis protein MviN/MurJ (putative lipid II flippase)